MSPCRPTTSLSGSISIDRHCFFLFLLIVAEAAIFLAVAETRLAPYYPANFDQTSYYLDTYELIERARKSAWAFVHEFTQPQQANGLSFTVQGALIGVVVGPNRTALLSLNFLYFIAVQLVLFTTARARSCRFSSAWIALALLLGSSAIVLRAGGIYDYRIDFAAMCTYGMWVCLVLRSESWSNARWTLPATIIAIHLVLMRFITVFYIGTVIIGMLLLSVARWVLARQDRAVAARYCRRVLAVGILTAVGVLPFLYLARGPLYDYYVIHHFMSDEGAIRAAELGLSTAFDHIVFYPKSVWRQVGPSSLIMVGILGVSAYLSAFWSGNSSLRRVWSSLGRFAIDFQTLALAVVCPLTILTLNFHKSSVVGGIVIVPVILLIVFAMHAVWHHEDVPIDRVSWPDPWRSAARTVARAFPALEARLWNVFSPRAVGSVLSGVFMLIGFIAFLAGSSANMHGRTKHDLAEIAKIHSSIEHYVIDNRLDHPSISFDRVMDYLNQGTIRLLAYERSHRMINLDPLFGHSDYGIFATPKDVALRLVQKSDIIILTDPVLARNPTIPMDTKIREYWNDMEAWTEQNRTLLFSTSIEGIPHRVYVVR